MSWPWPPPAPLIEVVEPRPNRRAPEPFRRIPGLDGLRGLAVLAVLLFHLWPNLLPGGFIGVTVFFSLSGYLITSILLHELDATGRISLRRFYSRRFRRLLPASLLTLLVVTVVWSALGWFTPAIRRDTFFALGQAANWGQALSHHAYGVDATASPVLHFWSLSVEEQMYLLLPVTLLLCRTRRRGLMVVCVALAGSVVAITQMAGSSTLTYYSTLARGGEVLVGAAAALAMHGRVWQRIATKVVSVIVALGAGAALVIVAMRTQVSDSIYTQGGLLACAAIAVVLVVCVAGWPALGTLVDLRPLARLGPLSYAVYLFHWPILQSLRHTALQPALVPWATLASTLVLALLSERWFELPIRTGQGNSKRLAVAGVCAVMVVPLVGVVGATTPAGTVDFEAVSSQMDQLVGGRSALSDAPSGAVASISSVTAAPPSTTEAPIGAAVSTSTTLASTVPKVPTVGFFGDSKALMLGYGSARVGVPGLEFHSGYMALGCPTGRTGQVRQYAGSAVSTLPPACDWTTGIPTEVAQNGRVDVAVVWSGTWDIADRKVPALGNTWMSVENEQYRTWLLAEMVALTDELQQQAGASRVIWLDLPVDPKAHHPERFEVWSELLHELQEQRPVVEIVSVATYVAMSGHPSQLLPDGIHPTAGIPPEPNSAVELVTNLIRPLVLSPATHAVQANRARPASPDVDRP